jgi:hypothetical protein
MKNKITKYKTVQRIWIFLCIIWIVSGCSNTVVQKEEVHENEEIKPMPTLSQEEANERSLELAEKKITVNDTDTTKDICFARVSAKTNDSSLCEKIKRIDLKDTCYWGIAIQTQNLSLCNNVKGVTDNPLITQDACLSVAAAGKEDTLTKKEEFSSDMVNDWMTYYYINPRPKLTVEMIKYMSEEDWFDDINTHVLWMAFFGEIFKQNENKIEEWYSELDKLPHSHKVLILESIWLSNTLEGNKLLEKMEGTATSKEKKDFYDEYMDIEPRDVLKVEIDSGTVLDMNWVSFFATGDERYVLRVMSVLPWVNERAEDWGPVENAIGKAAKWSLTSNAVQHKKVLEICQRELPQQPKRIRDVLQEVVDDALKELDEDK